MKRKDIKPGISTREVEMLRKESIINEIERRKQKPTCTPYFVSCESLGITQDELRSYRRAVRQWREKHPANKSLASPGSNQEEAGSSTPAETRSDATKDILSQSGSDTAERSAS